MLNIVSFTNIQKDMLNSWSLVSVNVTFLGNTVLADIIKLRWGQIGLRWAPKAMLGGRQEEKGVTEDEMVGWHHWLNWHEFAQTPGDGEGQGSLAFCNSWDLRVWHDWRTEQQPSQWLVFFPREIWKQVHTEGRQTCEDNGWDWYEAATSQECQSSPPEGKRGMEEFFPKAFRERVWLCWHLDLGLLVSRTERE